MDEFPRTTAFVRKMIICALRRRNGQHIDGGLSAAVYMRFADFGIADLFEDMERIEEYIRARQADG